MLGPTIAARAALEPPGRWEALRSQLLDPHERANEADDGTRRVSAEYLVTVAR